MCSLSFVVDDWSPLGLGFVIIRFVSVNINHQIAGLVETRCGDQVVIFLLLLLLLLVRLISTSFGAAVEDAGRSAARLSCAKQEDHQRDDDGQVKGQR